MATTKIQKFSDLIAWQEGHKLVIGVYRHTENFPSEEKFSLTSQIRRSAVSITSNKASVDRLLKTKYIFTLWLEDQC